MLRPALPFRHAFHRCLANNNTPISSKSIVRTFAGKPPQSDIQQVFSEPLKLLQRKNALRVLKHKASATSSLGVGQDEIAPTIDYNYFRREIANRMVDRLEDIKDRDFELALEIGTGMDNEVYKSIIREESLSGNGGGIGGIKKLVRLVNIEAEDDYEVEVVSTDTDKESNSELCDTFTMHHPLPSTLPYPFPSNSFSLIISNLSLHQANNLPGILSECHRLLKPDGCILLSFPGGDTLPELRASLLQAEQERTGGVSIHTGPFVELSSVGSLMNSAKFKLSTIDIDSINIGYSNMFLLLEHLQLMGEGNAALRRKQPAGIGLDTFLAAAAIYQEEYKEEDGGGGEGVVASTQVIYAIGWKEHESQQKADARGSAGAKIGEIKVVQSSAKEGVGSDNDGHLN